MVKHEFVFEPSNFINFGGIEVHFRYFYVMSVVLCVHIIMCTRHVLLASI